jgi:hypothetical protein
MPKRVRRRANSGGGWMMFAPIAVTRALNEKAQGQR